MCVYRCYWGCKRQRLSATWPCGGADCPSCLSRVGSSNSLVAATKQAGGGNLHGLHTFKGTRTVPGKAAVWCIGKLLGSGGGAAAGVGVGTGGGLWWGWAGRGDGTQLIPMFSQRRELANETKETGRTKSKQEEQR